MFKQIITFFNWLFFTKPIATIVEEPDELIEHLAEKTDEIVATDFVVMPDHMKTAYTKADN